MRTRLDIDRSVERGVLDECLDVALQAPIGSNNHGWQEVRSSGMTTPAPSRNAVCSAPDA